ncbi:MULTISPECIES: condensation domain-containing protein [Saccharothrix]|uniref:condensation domain-containing protein n=1 Tax=Saccharothrix TaxID=2071 RepID=UPI00095BAB6E|nr:condensation domain-containing protein [Saccharothrix sp. CB00851]OKI36550.1 hypothetical protein A6A25_20905 [Saccharothrix sp. CB00851]
MRHTARRHDMLRSSFADSGEHPVRVIHEDDVTGLRVRTVNADDLAPFVREVIAEPFSLREPPLVRFTLLRGPAEDVFVMVAHHIVVDAGSQGVIMRDLFESYRARRAGEAVDLPEPTATYADHVRAERGLLASPRMGELAAYWREICAGAPIALDLPADRPRPPVQRYRGAAVATRLPEHVLSALHDAARRAHVTPFVFLVGVFELLLHRYTGRPDFLIGCATSTKDRRMADVVGFFVNPVLLRPVVGTRTTFRELVTGTSAQLRRATAYRHYPFPMLPAALGVPHDPSRSPLFQVLVTAYMAGGGDALVDELFQGEGRGPFEYKGVRVAATPMPAQQTGQFDLTLELQMSRRSIGVTLKYATDLFDAGTVERLARWFVVLVESACADLDGVAGRLPMTDVAERDLLLSAGTAAPLDW